MNEQKQIERYYLFQKVDPLKEQWDNLILRLKTLMQSALVLCRFDLVKEISRQITVLENNKPNKYNKPNKKIYRVVLKFADKTESKLRNSNNNEHTR